MPVYDIRLYHHSVLAFYCLPLDHLHTDLKQVDCVP